MSNFKRENRYIVIKRADLRLADNQRTKAKGAGFSGQMQASVKPAMERLLDEVAANTRADVNKPPLACLVIESDWPEYETVWKMIQDRVEAEAKP